MTRILIAKRTAENYNPLSAFTQRTTVQYSFFVTMFYITAILLQSLITTSLRSQVKQRKPSSNITTVEVMENVVAKKVTITANAVNLIGTVFLTMP